MMKHIIYSSVVGLLLCTTAQANTDLTVEAEGLTKNGFINPDYALCVMLAKGETPPPGLLIIKQGA